MPRPSRVGRPLRQRVLLVLAVVLGALALLVAPVRAQDSGGGDGSDDGGATGTEPGGFPSPFGQPPPEPEPEPAPPPPAQPEGTQDEAREPVVREFVDDGDRSVQIVQVDTSGHPDIKVVVAVPPALAGELAASSFAMTENGKVRQLDVAKLRDVIEVVVVIDTSGSMDGDPLDAAKAAAQDFVASLSEDTTRVGLVGFGATASTRADFDASRADVRRAIDGLDAGGETALYDALVLAASELSDGDARKFVVVLSDGTDTASSATLDDAAAELLDRGVNLYAITLQSEDADFSGLQNLAAQVDGQVVAASDAASLSETYAAIASRLTNQYQLRYRTGRTGPADIVVSVDAEGILAIAKSSIDLGSGAGPATGPTTTSDPGATPTRPEIDTSNPEIVVAGADGSFLSSADAIYMGAAGLFLGVALVLFMAFSTEPKGSSAFERLNFKPKGGGGGGGRSGLASIADRATGLADRFLEKQEKRSALDASLEKAGMDMRPGEYVMAVAGAAVALGGFGFVMFSPIAGAVLLGVGLLGGRMYVGMRASKRQKLFGNQLGDTLMMIAGSIRAGHGVMEAIDTVASQADAPTGEEFSRAVAEARIGRDMIDSLYDIAERTESEDFVWVVRAISINRELGGDLAEILDNVGETIRDRNRLRDQVKALSAEGKVSAVILFGLPILVGLWVRVSNPEYLASMTDETAGKVMLGMAVFALLSGGLWLKKLVKVDF